MTSKPPHPHAHPGPIDLEVPRPKHRGLLPAPAGGCGDSQEPLNPRPLHRSRIAEELAAFTEGVSAYVLSGRHPTRPQGQFYRQFTAKRPLKVTSAGSRTNELLSRGSRPRGQQQPRPMCCVLVICGAVAAGPGNLFQPSTPTALNRERGTPSCVDPNGGNWVRR